MGAHPTPRRIRTAGGLVVLPVIALTGAAVGLAEWGYHTLGPLPAAGEPGAGGPSLMGFLGLGITEIAVPALLVALLTLGAWRWLAVGATWLAALLPSAVVALAHLAFQRRWTWFAPEDLHEHYLKLFGLAGAGALLGAFCGALVSYRLLGRSARAQSRGWSLAIACAGTVLTLAGPWLLWTSLRRPAPAPASAPGALPDVLLLTVDTLRRDAVGAYGGPATPAMDALLASGVRAAGYSPAPWTRPAMAALFCGLATTGNGAARMHGVNPQADWWPEHLQQAGYATAAFICNPHLKPQSGFRRGFSTFDHAGELELLDPIAQSVRARWLTRQVVERLELDRGDQIAGRAIRWLKRKPAGPWLLWVHLADPHMPYFLRGPHGEMSDPQPGAWLDPLRPDLERGAFRAVQRARRGEAAASPQARAAVRMLYEREVLFADRQVGRLVEAARAASAERGLVWVLTSDHGEEFWEHGGFEHGHALHDEILQVPFGVGGPGLPAGGWIGGMKLQDIGPTLLALLALPPMDVRQGSRLRAPDDLLAPMALGADRSAELRGAGPVAPRCAPPPLLAEGMLYGPPQTRLIFPGGLSVTRADSTGHAWAEDDCDPSVPSAEGEVWFAASVGPSVSPQLAALLPPDRMRVFEQLWAWRDAAQDLGAPVHVDEATRERLRALGYTE